ncbi:hypothetical protein KEM56_001353 [Ascosphaera pollenicola]|nr:hypothetical protein KEM56_001353 [Ascosphaera pollenicola]
MPGLPPVYTLQQLPLEEKCEVIDTLFEHSPTLHSVVLPILSRHTFQSYPAFIAHVGHTLATMQSDGENGKLDAILGAHPRLGEKRDKVSDLSRREQANLNSPSPVEQDQQPIENGADSAAPSPVQREEMGHRHRGSGSLEGIASELQRWNDLYEARFPGLRYVTFVNARPREEIIQDMINRIHRGDLERERSEAISAICLIAVDRARKLAGS